MRFALLLSVLFAAVAASTAGGSPAAPARHLGSFPLQATFPTQFQFTDCPAGVSATECALTTGGGVVPGLGRVSERYTFELDQSDPSCQHSSFTPVVLAVAGKGEIYAALADPYMPCDPPEHALPVVDFTITGGSGLYAGASGSGTLTSGTQTDFWKGTLAVPGLDFDTTPPKIIARNKTVVVRKHAKRVRVRYKVTARDAVDGSVSVSCKPRSGSRFKVGRTKVRCAATDSSENTANAAFTVKVKRKRRR